MCWWQDNQQTVGTLVFSGAGQRFPHLPTSPGHHTLQVIALFLTVDLKRSLFYVTNDLWFWPPGCFTTYYLKPWPFSHFTAFDLNLHQFVFLFMTFKSLHIVLLYITYDFWPWLSDHFTTFELWPWLSDHFATFDLWPWPSHHFTNNDLWLWPSDHFTTFDLWPWPSDHYKLITFDLWKTTYRYS